MEFRIADTFTDSLAPLTGDAQKAVKTTAIAVSALVWYEFLSGPLAETEAGLARAFLEGRILSVG